MRIWVDMTSPPHPLVLRPIIALLRASAHEVVVTTRRFGQTEATLDRLGIAHEVIDRHGGASTIGKAGALARRSAPLPLGAPATVRPRPRPRVGRPRRRLRDPARAGRADAGLRVRRPAAPNQLQSRTPGAGPRRDPSRSAARTRRIAVEPLPVPGLKEDYYLSDFEPDPSVLSGLGIDRRRILAVVRPPDDTSAYRSRNRLYDAVLDRLAADPQTVAVVLPRNEDQRRAARARAGDSLIVPDRVIDAQSLVAYADLVVSGGGTMNREAVALGTPAYTIFGGRIGAVDERLIAAGRLRRLADPTQLELRKRTTEPGPRHPRDPRILVAGVLGTCAG